VQRLDLIDLHEAGDAMFAACLSRLPQIEKDARAYCVVLSFYSMGIAGAQRILRGVRWSRLREQASRILKGFLDSRPAIFVISTEGTNLSDVRFLASLETSCSALP
jgi:hypothetical protein